MVNRNYVYTVFLFIVLLLFVSCGSEKNEVSNIGTSSTANGIQLNVIEVLLGRQALNYAINNFADVKIFDSPYQTDPGWRNAVVRISAKNLSFQPISFSNICGYVVDTGGYRREFIRNHVNIHGRINGSVNLPANVEVTGIDSTFLIPENQEPAEMVLQLCNGGPEWKFDLQVPLQSVSKPADIISHQELQNLTINYNVPGVYNLRLDNFHLYQEPITKGAAPDIRIGYNITLENTGGYNYSLRKGPLFLINDSNGKSVESPISISHDDGMTGSPVVGPGVTNSGSWGMVGYMVRISEAPDWIHLTLVPSKTNRQPIFETTIEVPDVDVIPMK